MSEEKQDLRPKVLWVAVGNISEPKQLESLFRRVMNTTDPDRRGLYRLAAQRDANDHRLFNVRIDLVEANVQINIFDHTGREKVAIIDPYEAIRIEDHIPTDFRITLDRRQQASAD